MRFFAITFLLSTSTVYHCRAVGVAPYENYNLHLDNFVPTPSTQIAAEPLGFIGFTTVDVQVPDAAGALSIIQPQQMADEQTRATEMTDVEADESLEWVQQTMNTNGRPNLFSASLVESNKMSALESEYGLLEETSEESSRDYSTSYNQVTSGSELTRRLDACSTQMAFALAFGMILFL